jgi:acyl-CoA synthetase (AMP-forming)/AMP-acid ligase II
MWTEIERLVLEMTGPGGDYPVETVAIAGVTYKAIQNTPANLREYYSLLALYPDRTFIVYGNQRWTFAEVQTEVQRLAHAMVNKLGAGPGTHVAIAMRNYPEWIFAFMATTSIGAVAVPLNAWWTTEEFDYALGDADVSIVFADDKRLAVLKKPITKHKIKPIAVRFEGKVPKGVMSYESLIAGEPSDSMPGLPIDPDQDATIIYTSGSTGKPKGVVASHRSHCSVMLMWALNVKARIETQGYTPETLPFPSATLLTIPLFHVTGLHALFMLSIIIGRKLVFMFKWDAEEALRMIEKEQITSLTGVPTMSWEILNSPAADKYNLESLNEFGSGGAARPAEHVGRLYERFPQTFSSSGYGLTETNAAGSVNWGPDYLDRPGSTGKPMQPLVEMKIVDPQGKELPTGASGEVLIKSVCNARGYWKQPQATAEAFRNGWFYTGDIGRLDEDNYLYIVDRAKDIIIRGGENISCLEVESIIYQHPDVMETVVFGMPDERLGEIVAAVVVPKKGHSIDIKALQSFIGEHLAGFKIPAIIWVQSEQLPRTASGKIFKRQIRDEKLQES